MTKRGQEMNKTRGKKLENDKGNFRGRCSRAGKSLAAHKGKKGEGTSVVGKWMDIEGFR